MDKTEIGLLVVALIKAELNQTEIPSSVKEKLTPEVLPFLYIMSKAHDLAHIVGDALFKNGVQISDELKAKFIKQQSLAIFRYERIKFELEDICSFFDQKCIPYMPLKGSVIRKYYPRPEMRTSCDIDILVKKKDVDKAVALLIKEKGYRKEGKNNHDISLFSPSGVHLELHFKFMGEKFSYTEKILTQSWKDKNPYLNSRLGQSMSVEHLLLYLTLHNAKHFYNGGCGIRSAMDIFVIYKGESFELDKLCQLLDKCKIKKFWLNFEKLINYWFNDAVADSTILMMQNYIISGGVYGSLENKVETKVLEHKNKFIFVLKRLFVPYSLLRFSYPILEKLPVLYPFLIIGRWFKLLSPSKRKKVRREMELGNMTNEQKENKRKFLEDMGL